MTSYSKHKWECISPGEYDTTYKCSACGALFTDQADDPNSLIPEFGCTVTTDLSNKSVEELTSWFNEEATSVDGIIRLGLAYDEIARRLEEAQQKIVSQQAKLDKAFHLTFSEKGNPLTENAKINLIRDLLRCGDFEAIAAHDAKVAAEAKAEALEEAVARITKEVTGLDGEVRFDSGFVKSYLLMLAAEYRAKAKGE